MVLRVGQSHHDVLENLASSVQSMTMACVRTLEAERNEFISARLLLRSRAAGNLDVENKDQRID